MTVSALIAAFLVFARLGGLIVFMPAVSLKMIPNETKIVLLVALTVVIVPTVPEIQAQPSIGLLFLSIISEFLFGLIMGWIVNLVFAGMSMGTEVISTQIGQAAANQFNPAMSISQSPIGGIALLLTLCVFLSMNMHLYMIQVLAESFQPIPPGEISNLLPGLGVWIDHTDNIISTGIQIAGPILTLVLLNNSFLAVLSRLAPNMNVFFSVGFLVSMIGGLVVFSILLPHIMEMVLLGCKEALITMRDITEMVAR